MLSRLIKCLLVFILSTGLYAADTTLEVLVKKTDLSPGVNASELLIVNGIRQALTAEMVKGELDPALFWGKIESRKLAIADEVNLLRPLFSKFELRPVTAVVQPSPIKTGAPQNTAPTTPATASSDPFIRGNLVYDLDQVGLKTYYKNLISDMPDVSVKTFYIIPDINISREMSWADVGVTKKEFFSGVIVDSWKKWAVTQFKNFPNVVVLEKNFSPIPENMNPESVTLKWNSLLKKGEVYQDRKSARFELNAQYVIVNTLTNQSLVAFDFPAQKREVTIFNPKDLSSNLASLVYNLLNSQTVKINSALEQSKSMPMSKNVDVKVKGKLGLFAITQINNFLSEQFKDINLSSKLKSYSPEGSIITITSNLSGVDLFQKFSQSGGKLLFDEQKILLFSSEDQSFAFIPKEANN